MTKWETSTQDVPLMAGHKPSPGKEFANKQENLNLFQPLHLNSSLQETQRTEGHVMWLNPTPGGKQQIQPRGKTLWNKRPSLFIKNIKCRGRKNGDKTYNLWDISINRKLFGLWFKQSIKNNYETIGRMWTQTGYLIPRDY